MFISTGTRVGCNVNIFVGISEWVSSLFLDVMKYHLCFSMPRGNGNQSLLVRHFCSMPES